MLVSNPLQSCITFGQISTIILHTQNWVMLSTCACMYVCACTQDLHSLLPLIALPQDQAPSFVVGDQHIPQQITYRL